MKQFERNILLNEATKTNALHVSLNFDLADKITDERLVEIGINYMEGIGFCK